MLGCLVECPLLTRKTGLPCMLANRSTVESVAAHNTVLCQHWHSGSRADCAARHCVFDPSTGQVRLLKCSHMQCIWPAQWRSTGSLYPALSLQVVIDAIPPAVLVSDCSSKTFDFGTIPDEDLLDIKLPLQLHIGALTLLDLFHLH